MRQLTGRVKCVNHLDKELIQSAAPQPESLLTVVGLDDKESGPCLYLIVGWARGLMYAKANQTGDSCNAGIRSTFSLSSR